MLDLVLLFPSGRFEVAMLGDNEVGDASELEKKFQSFSNSDWSKYYDVGWIIDVYFMCLCLEAYLSATLFILEI